jgi:hypothetical protein
VKTSLLQAQIFMLDFQATRWLMEHEVPPQAGNNHPTIVARAECVATTWGKTCKSDLSTIGSGENLEKVRT